MTPIVVLLRGLNVGGHRALRPSNLAQKLRHLGAVSIGAAGTFVIHGPVNRTRLLAEFKRRLPFDSATIIVNGREVLDLLSNNPFGEGPAPAGSVRFVSVLERVPRTSPRLPVRMPSRGKWLLQVLGRRGRFVFGRYRRHMKVIGYLGSLDRLFGTQAITRNWNTINAVTSAIRNRTQEARTHESIRLHPIRTAGSSRIARGSQARSKKR